MTNDATNRTPARRRRRDSWILVAALLASPGCGPRGGNHAGGSGERAFEERPSILLITIDTLRADHLGCFGYAPYDEPVTPEIDRFAKGAARFTNCFAPRAQTMPSLTSLMTGVFPSQHGVLENAQPFPLGRPTLFERAAALGYETAAFLSFLPTTAEGNPARGAALIVAGRDTGPRGPRLDAQWQWDANTALRAISWLDARPTDPAHPFFAWVHFYDVHQPYSPPEPYDRMFTGDYAGPLLVRKGASQAEFAGIERRLDEAALANAPLSPADHAYVLALYDGGIRSADRHVGAILEALAKRRLDANTLVIVMADHGEELGDHNSYYYHGNSVYDAALRIPLLVRWPNRVPAGSVVDAIVQNVDLAPTILDWWGEPPSSEMEGISFAGLLDGSGSGSRAPAQREAAFAEWQDLLVSVRTPTWKFIYNPKGAHPKKPPYFGGDNTGFAVRCEELYPVGADPGERTDVLATQRAAADSLRALAIAHRDRPGGASAIVPTNEADITDELRSLGYVGAPADRGDVVIGAERCEGGTP